MLEIKLCLEKPVVAAYCKKIKKPVSEAFYLYRAMNRDQELAAALFEVRSDRVSVELYECADENDYFLFDGILRAGLNYAAEQGIETGYIPEYFRQEHKALFAKLNYPPEPALNIINFFAKYKSCSGSNRSL